MDKLQFEFAIKSSDDSKSNILAVTSIATVDGKVYKMPEMYQSAIHHTKLAETETFKKVKNSIKKRHETRRVWINLSEELTNIYLDGDNIQFANYYLEEITDRTQKTKHVGMSEEALTKILEKFAHLGNTNPQVPQQINLKKISEKFVIEKFDGENSNVTQWIETFERECVRLNVHEDENKIEIFRLFLEKSCIHWYSSMLIKFTLSSEWNRWKKDFCDTYENKGWAPIRYAMELQYKSGSLLEYAIRKEKVLL